MTRCAGLSRVCWRNLPPCEDMYRERTGTGTRAPLQLLYAEESSDAGYLADVGGSGVIYGRR